MPTPAAKEQATFPDPSRFRGVTLALGEISGVRAGEYDSAGGEHGLGGPVAAFSVLQAYYDHTERQRAADLEDSQGIVDLQLQYSASPIGAHKAVFPGAEYR